MSGLASGRPRREGVLRRRLLGAFLLLSLVPLFGSNAIGYRRSRGIVGHLVSRYLDGMASVQALHIQGRVEQRLLYLAAIANGNRFLEAAALRGTGRDGADMAAVADPEAVRDYLTRKLDESGHFGALALFSPTGERLASTDTSSGLNRWSPDDSAAVTVERMTGSTWPPALRLAVPVANDAGARLAYLVATIPLNEGGEFLEIPKHVAGTIESFIVDGRGLPVFVSHPHGDLRYDRPLESPLARAGGETQARYRNREGVDVIGASAALPSLGWRFVAEVPAADALGDLATLRNLSLMLGSLFAALVLVAGWGLAGGIVAPVRRLVTATRALGAGRLDVRVPDPGEDEIGELSEAFNEMAAELKANHERLDQMHRREIERAQQLATVGELASGVAHEIKNPVVGISNGLDLVLRRVEDPALDPITSEMQRQLRRIEDAVRDLLAFARPARPEVAPADIDRVVSRALALVGPAAGKKKVTIVPRLAGDLPPIDIDAELVGQALVNLLMNAVQASPEGSSVNLETAVRDGAIRIDVVDRGPGLNTVELERIFKPFYTTKHSGTGLGLPITRGIVERHGGTIEAESAPGAGSRFTVILPLDARGVNGGEA